MLHGITDVRFYDMSYHVQSRGKKLYKEHIVHCWSQCRVECYVIIQSVVDLQHIGHQ